LSLLELSLAGRSLSIEPGARIEFGEGALATLPDAVVSVGRSRAFVVTDPGLRGAGVLGRVLAVLTSAGMEHEVFEGVRPNPSTTDLDAAGERVRAFCARAGAAVVALGGGSALDSAKGIALLGTNPGTAADFDYRREPPGPGLPVVAVPTTAGTGSETNEFGVIEDCAAQCKIYVGHSSVRPKVAILDPELTLGLPRAATAATGFDALVHGIESLASRGATPMSAAYATQAVAMVSRWLPIAVEDGSDLEARAQMLLGAHLAGRALTLSGLGLVHGIAHSLTNHLHTVHGVALAGVLPEVMQFCADGPDDAARAAYRTVALAMGVADPIAASRELAEAIGVRVRLSALGLTTDTVDRVARGAVEDVVTANSPRTPTHPEVETLLHSAL
jgi:alcohol dehydrogenase class IV